MQFTMARWRIFWKDRWLGRIHTPQGLPSKWCRSLVVHEGHLFVVYKTWSFSVFHVFSKTWFTLHSDASLQFVSRQLPRVFERGTDRFCIHVYIHVRFNTLLSAMLPQVRRSGFSHSHVNLEGFVTLSSLCPDVSKPPCEALPRHVYVDSGDNSLEDAFKKYRFSLIIDDEEITISRALIHSIGWATWYALRNGMAPHEYR